MVLNIKNLCYTPPFSDKLILNNINFNIFDGEFILLTGPTGSGKSTLLSLMRGLLFEMGGNISGDIEFNGNSIINMKPWDIGNNIGLLWQNPSAQLHQRSVLQELISGLVYQGYSVEKAIHTAHIVAERLKIESWLEWETSFLSTGQQQIVAFASILVMNPKVVLLDEPTAYLDPWMETTLKEILFEEKKKGRTIIIATHTPERFLNISSSQLILQSGSIVFKGNPFDVCNNRRLSELSIGGPFYTALKRAKRIKQDFNPTDWFDFSYEMLESFLSKTTQETSQDDNSRIEISFEKIYSQLLGNFQLSDINISINSGKLFGIIGPNGGGKTTFIRLLLGFVKIHKGRLLLGGRDYTNLLPHERIEDIGYSCQNPQDTLFESTVLSECLFKPKMLKYSNFINAAEEAIEMLGIKSLSDRDPMSLSGGEQRLVTLATSLACNPDVLLLDEPEFGLDPVWRERVWKLLRKLANNNKTIIVVTHDIDGLITHADMISIMSNGHIGMPAAGTKELRSKSSWDLIYRVPTLLSAIENQKELGAHSFPIVFEEENN